MNHLWGKNILTTLNKLNPYNIWKKTLVSDITSLNHSSFLLKGKSTLKKLMETYRKLKAL